MFNRPRNCLRSWILPVLMVVGPPLLIYIGFSSAEFASNVRDGQEAPPGVFEKLVFVCSILFLCSIWVLGVVRVSKMRMDR
jgi:hypothetical protein